MTEDLLHGSLFVELKKYVEGAAPPVGRQQAPHTRTPWKWVLSDAGLAAREYELLQSYPFAEFSRLVRAAAQLYDKTPEIYLEAFGERLAPALMGMFAPAIDAEWRTLDLIEHTEDTLHTLVRLRRATVQPPYMIVTRTSQSEVFVRYLSRRRLCHLLRGIVHGVATYYGERVLIMENACMLKGAKECRLIVRLA